MKLIVGMLFLVIGTILAADEPKGLGNIRGVMLSGLSERIAFSYTPGANNRCERKVVVDWLTFRCEVGGASLRLPGLEPRSVKPQVERVHIFFKPLRSGDIQREYLYQGTWSEESNGLKLTSKMKLSLWYLDSEPSNVRGVLELEDLGLSLPLFGGRSE